MPFILIRGFFDPTSGVPDGDSVRFKATDEDDPLFDKLDGKVKVEFKSGGQVQLRYEGVDALEKGAISPFSEDATEGNIQLLGGRKPDLAGYILSRRTDPYGRPVCFVFTGDAPNWDNSGGGEQLQVDLLRQSVNYKLLQEGHVYPMFYDTLYKELRDEMVVATKEARAAKRGIWPADRSTIGFRVDIPLDLEKLPPIFPKLWRRLQTFYQQQTNRNNGLEMFLLDLLKGEDRVFTIPDQRWIKFSTTLQVVGGKLKMLYKPEELIFASD